MSTTVKPRIRDFGVIPNGEEFRDSEGRLYVKTPLEAGPNPTAVVGAVPSHTGRYDPEPEVRDEVGERLYTGGDVPGIVRDFDEDESVIRLMYDLDGEGP